MDTLWTMPHDQDPPGEAPPMRMLSVPWEGVSVRLAFRLREGRSQSPALALLHGLGCSQRSFAGIWRHPDFAARTVLSLDLPGFGDSERPDTFGYRLEDHAGIAAALLRSLELENVFLAGHSMGGAIAVLMAGLVQPLAGLVSVEGNLIAEDCGVSRVVAGMPRQRFEQQFFPELKTRTTALHRAYMALELAAPLAFYNSSDSLWNWSRSGKLLRRFLELDTPRLYIHGRRDKNIPVLERLQGVEKRAIPDSGHFPMNENPTAFYRELGEWLRTCRLP